MSSYLPHHRRRWEEKDAREGGARPAARGRALSLLLKPSTIVTVDEATNVATVRRWEGILSLLPSEEAAATVCTEMRSVARIKGRSGCFAAAVCWVQDRRCCSCSVLSLLQVS
ncbi:uncharacterized protein DS421_14g461800 [Arachis hypogaea]|nr:uncharacterized protein DS421_14g461800 [Arachis hypogaea]